MSKKVGLYIHIPFCATKCPYCDFYSVNYKRSLEALYILALSNHINTFKSKGICVDTIYFGGGTPSLIQSDSIKKVLAEIHSVFLVDDDCEISIEVNPKTVDYKKVNEYYSMGINRISIGMQSADDEQLSYLGRKHTIDDVENVINYCHYNGIDNISLDLMLGTPNQSEKHLDNSLEFINKHNIKHISAYMLKIEDNTPFKLNNVIELCPNDEKVSNYYLKVVDYLNQIGIYQYEVSNFAKLGFESRHNLKYWNLSDYIGFGPTAHSYYQNKRFYHENDLNAYIKTNGTNLTVEPTENDFFEFFMLSLRLVKGVNLSYAKKLYNVDDNIINSISNKATFLSKHNLVNIQGDVISLTKNGFLLSNEITIQLFNI